MAAEWCWCAAWRKDKPYVLPSALSAGEAGSEWVRIANGYKILAETLDQIGKIQVNRVPAELVIAVGGQAIAVCLKIAKGTIG